MAGKINVYERAEREIQKDRLWKAKEILQGNLRRFGYDKKLYEMYGKLLDRLGDRMEAGRYLFLSGKIKAKDSDAILLYLKRHTRKKPIYLLRTFPKAAWLRNIEDYPKSVATVLKDLGLENNDLEVEFNFYHKDLYSRLPKPAQHKETWFDKVDEHVPAVGCIIGIIFLAICLIAGFFTVIRWIAR